MGLFDILGTGDQQAAAQAQIAGLNAANKAGQTNLDQGLTDINTSAAPGVAAVGGNQASNTQGVDALKKLLGIGPAGPNDIQTTLENLPGYKFAVDQANTNADRTAAAGGYNASGTELAALGKLDQGLASQNYGNYVNELTPFLGAQTTTGGQVAQTGLTLGGQQNANRTTSANMNYGTQVGIGNVNANADLAGLTASSNDINALLQGGKLAAGLFGML